LKGIADILARCIEEVKSGRSSVADCLERYPAFREHLEPLLGIALSIEEPRDVKPSAAFKLRTRVSLMEHIHAASVEKKPRGIVSILTGRFRTLAVTVSVSIAIVGLGGVMAFASQESLPGDTLYPAKRGTEQIRLVLTNGDAACLELELAFAEQRLQEMEAMADTRPERVEMSINEYERNINQAISRVEQSEGAETSASRWETVGATILGHLSILDRVEENVLEEEKVMVSNLRERISNRLAGILRLMMEENPVRAAEINLDAMGGWLERASVQAEAAEEVEVDKSLHQFEVLSQLGNEISQTVDGKSAAANIIDKMNARVAPRHLVMLAAIHEKVPGPRREAVESAMSLALQDYCQVLARLEESSVAGDSVSPTPELSNQLPSSAKERILNRFAGRTEQPAPVREAIRERMLTRLAE